MHIFVMYAICSGNTSGTKWISKELYQTLLCTSIKMLADTGKLLIIFVL